MSNVVIQVENLSKYYRLGLTGGGTLREDINRWWAKLRGQPDPLRRIGQSDHGNRKDGQLWALRDINLQVKQGEILGIIGRNGAGKSTQSPFEPPLTLDETEQYLSAVFPPLGLALSARTRQELTVMIEEDLDALWRHIATASDAALAPDARAVRAWLNARFPGAAHAA